MRPQDLIKLPPNPVVDAKERVETLLMDIGVAHEDTNGLMTHILDCLGLLHRYSYFCCLILYFRSFKATFAT